MSKFVIECQQCGNYAEASNFIFAKKHINCSCGNVIDVRADRMSSRDCPYCGNMVVFDQAKGDKALCPVCHNKINTIDQIANLVNFHCPSCSCNLSADKNAQSYTCPLCDTVIDVQKQVAKETEKKKGLASVIKYEGDNQTFVWKHPIEDFNLGSQLIVHESQEAVFFRDGQALDLFGAGRYTLATQNLPLLENLYKFPTNVDTPFHSEVYFINKTVQMGIKWGTDSKIRFLDTVSGLPIEIGASGQFNLKVSDSRKLLIKLVGTASEFTQADVIDGSYGMKPTIAKFRAMIMTKVKSNLARVIKEKNINILEVDEHLDEISSTLCDVINENLVEYGLLMPEFFVTNIVTPDDDPNFQRLKQQHADMYLKVREEQVLKAEAEASAERQAVEAATAARMKVIGAQGEAEAYKLKAEAEAAEMRMKGYTYQQETARQVGLAAMENIGSGGGAGSGIGDIAGLGVTLGAMGSVMGMTREALNPVAANAQGAGHAIGETINPTANGWDCECGHRNITTKFCPDCGKPKPEPVANNGWDCAECGTKSITSKFCPNCGSKRPEQPSGWTCPNCGAQNITSKFCPDCGNAKPSEPEKWDCPNCGHKDITSGFCPDCGHKKGE